MTKERVDKITQRDLAAFEIATSDQQYKGGLILPYEALRYLFIPKRLLELVGHPEMVQLTTSVPTESGVRGITYYWDPIPYIENTPPVQWTRRIRRNHYQVLEVNLNSLIRDPKSPILFVDQYSDLQKYREKGVATSFYERLRECAIRMSYRFIYGFNTNLRERKFFVERMGRVPLWKTKPELWDLISNEAFGWYQQFKTMTIDFLDPKDKERYEERNPGNFVSRWEEYMFRKLASKH